MNKDQVISDEVLTRLQIAVSKGEYWMAYNNSVYFIEPNDVYFFSNSQEAKEFCENNISDYDRFSVIHVRSIEDLLKQIPYGETLNRQLINPDANGLYNSDGNAFTDELIEYVEQQQILNNKKLSIMNEQNFQYLKDNIKYMGFGEKQNDTLEQHLKEGKESFQLTYKAEVNKKAFEAVLQFRKSDNSDMYFFNSYQASLERKNGEQVEQTFYLTKGKGVTAKEAYNLLEGRAVFKELSNKAGEPYKAWIQLDFDNKDKNNNNEVKQYHEKYGYDLKEAVGKYAISELDGGEKEKALMQSLQKGNIQSVFIEKEGSISKMFIEANPQYKTATLYNAEMKREQKEELGKYQALDQSQEKEVKQEQKQEVKQDEKKSIKQKNSNDLGGPKKKSSGKKGMSV